MANILMWLASQLAVVKGISLVVGDYGEHGHSGTYNFKLSGCTGLSNPFTEAPLQLLAHL